MNGRPTALIHSPVTRFTSIHSFFFFHKCKEMASWFRCWNADPPPVLSPKPMTKSSSLVNEWKHQQLQQEISYEKWDRRCLTVTCLAQIIWTPPKQMLLVILIFSLAFCKHTRKSKSHPGPHACSTWQCRMWLFKPLRPAILNHKLVTRVLKWPLPAIFSHIWGLLSTGLSGLETSTKLILMLLRMMQSFPLRGTSAAASNARELPRWSLLSINLFHESVDLS